MPRTGLGNDERGVHECLNPEVPSCCTEQLCPAGHVVQDGNGSEADTQFDEEELHRHRNDNRGDEDRDEMHDYRCTGVDEDTRKNRNPHKRHEVNRQSEMQAEARQTDDEEHLQGEEQDFREGSEVLRPEDYEIEHKKGKEKKYQEGLAEERPTTLAMSERLTLVRPAKRLKGLVVTLGDDLAFLYDFLSFLDKPLCGREGREELGSHLVGQKGVPHEVLSAVIAEMIVRRFERIDRREGVRLLYFALRDSNAAVLVFLQPFHLLKRDYKDLALYLWDVVIARHEDGEELFLLLGKLVVGFVYGEIKIRFERSVPPWFADLKMVAEGVVIPRKHKDNHCRKYRKNA